MAGLTNKLDYWGRAILEHFIVPGQNSYFRRRVASELLNKIFRFSRELHQSVKASNNKGAAACRKKHRISTIAYRFPPSPWWSCLWPSVCAVSESASLTGNRPESDGCGILPSSPTEETPMEDITIPDREAKAVDLTRYNQKDESFIILSEHLVSTTAEIMTDSGETHLNL